MRSKQIHRKLLFFLFFILLLLTTGSTFVSAACHVVTPNGAGSRDGSTWDNAFAGLPATLLRGDTYYIAAGNYPAYNFNTPASGTNTITIKKATATDHCADTGFQASFGTGQAVWTPSGGAAIWKFTTCGSSHWILDGQYRSDLKSGHGFLLDNSSNTVPYAVNIDGSGCSPNAISNVTVRYVEIKGGGVGSNTGDSFSISSAVRDASGTTATITVPSNHRYLAQSSTVVGSQINVSGVSDSSFNTANSRVTAITNTTVSYANSGTANATSSGGTVTGALGTLSEFDFRVAEYSDRLTLEYSYIHDTSDTPLQNDGQSSNLTFQHNAIARNNSNGQHHSEGFADRASNCPTGCGSGNTSSVDPNGTDIIRYNVFEDIEGTGFLVCVSSGGGAGQCNNWQVYGNVLMWHQGNPYRRSGLGNGVIATVSTSIANNWVVYNNTFVNLPNGSIFSTFNRAGGSGFTAYNNLCYSPSGVTCSYPEKVTGEITHDYTACFTAGSCPSEAHIQTGSSNTPLVDWVSEDYHLSAATSAGITLPAPYNIDPDGSIRGAAGLWNRGAYEFLGLIRPAPPTNLRIVP